MNYKVTRIGLLNFWYFDDEEFKFSDGNLLLRGENGSGKSVTMQSFIPLILDGNKSPNRLDPFGSKEKRIEDYLLGPADGVQKEESIGYLYMEVYSKELDKYITVGMGLRARKGRGTDFWGFALKDGRRIGENFLLYKDYGQKILLTKNELKARLGKDNEFTESSKEYKSIVNKLLFGFKELDAYDEFINVLLQLRSSKLSKDYTPTKLMSILSSVLQPLTEDDLRPLSEAIEDTNKTKETIEKLTSQVKSLTNFIKTYQNYNEILLYNKAKDVFEEQKVIEGKTSDISQKEEEIIKIQSRLEKIKNKFSSLEQEFTSNSVRLEMIDDKELKKHTENLEKIKSEIKESEDQVKEIKAKLEKLFDKEKNIAIAQEEITNNIYKKEKELSRSCEDIISLSDEIKLPDIQVAVKNIQKEKEVDFSYLDERVNKYKNKLNQVKIKLEEKEQLENELNQRQEEHLKLKKEYEEKEKEQKIKEKTLIEAIDTFKDEINKINKQNKIVILEEEYRTKIFDLINNYNHQNYIESKEIYQRVVNYYQVRALEEKNNIVNKINIEEENLNVLKEELRELKENKELEFSLTEEDVETMNKLSELNIPHIPLYKAIEFKENIPDNDKNRIEEILLTMNILNANIVPNSKLKNIANLKGVFLKAGTSKKNNLLSYVNTIENNIVEVEEVRKILSSISVDTSEDNYISPSKYQLDFIIGFSGEKYESKYIGILKRIENQKRKINAKEEEISLKESVINNYRNMLETVKNKLLSIEEESKLFPSDKPLEDARKELDKIEISLEIISSSIRNITDIITEISKKIELKIQEINNVKENIQIPLNLASYKEALNIIDLLIKNIYDLKSVYNSLELQRDRKVSCESELEETTENINYQNAELSNKNNHLNKLLSQKKTIDEILSNPDYQNILEEVKKLTERQNKIPEEKIALSEEKGKLENSLNNLKEEVHTNREKLSQDLLRLELKNNILTKEYNLKYVYQDEEININKILNDLKDRKNSDISRALTNYLESFNEYRTELLEYRIATKEIFNSNDSLISEYTDKGMDEDELLTLLNGAIRQDLTTIYQGKIMNVYELLICLKSAIEESESYISTQERHLFEDILLKTVGNKIRDRIESSKEWVSQINEIMKNTQIDSNLSFQLDWKSKEAYTEEELDTKELVRLFKIEPGMIDKKDSDKLITHFRSQIKKELEYSEKTHESYTSIIGRVLDYRNWFEFKLYYRRKSGEKKELNNKVFFVLSGGERAKSMYVPLFASVYAKLLTAEPKALRLIALDEAFAGVDNSNIREMFAILSQLNLDYIMTSQALWGDYDTVKSLSICELIKDEPNRAVAVRRYCWNGHSKEIIER